MPKVHSEVEHHPACSPRALTVFHKRKGWEEIPSQTLRRERPPVGCGALAAVDLSASALYMSNGNIESGSHRLTLHGVLREEALIHAGFS